VKRRGVSEVTGGVVMLGIVGTVAALVLTIGLGSIYDFNTFLVDVGSTEEDLKENFVVEFVEFQIGTDDIKLHVRNIGLNQVTINTISVVNIDTQILTKSVTDLSEVIPPRDKAEIQVELTGCAVFAAPAADCTDASYRITLLTGRGNIYEIEVVPLRG